VESPVGFSDGAFCVGGLGEIANFEGVISREQRWSISGERPSEFADQQPGVSTRVRSAQFEQIVRSEAAAIEGPFGDVVRLRLDGLEPREIAKELEINVNTVRSRLVRGLARLREQLEQTLGSDRLG